MLQWQNQRVSRAEIGDSNQRGRPRGSDHRRLIVFDNAATVPETSRSPPQGAHQSLLCDLVRLPDLCSPARISAYLPIKRYRISYQVFSRYRGDFLIVFPASQFMRMAAHSDLGDDDRSNLNEKFGRLWRRREREEAFLKRVSSDNQVTKPGATV